MRLTWWASGRFHDERQGWIRVVAGLTPVTRPPPAGWSVKVTQLFRCIGCGNEWVKVKHTYGKKCRRRIEAGLPTDLDEYVTDADYRALAHRDPGHFKRD